MVIGILIGLVFSSLSQATIYPDISIYCKDLAAVTDICSDPYHSFQCETTCSNTNSATLKCGLRPVKKDSTGEGGHTEHPHELKAQDLMQARVMMADTKMKARDMADKLKIQNVNNKQDEEGNIPKERVRRIVGGNRAKHGYYPWNVALIFQGTQVCSGSIIAPGWVLTAAHCFDKDHTSLLESDWTVVAGEHQLFVNDRTEQVKGVKKLVVHYQNQKFRKMHKSFEDWPDDYDIALLRLDSNLQYTKHVQPICIPQNAQKFKDNDLCTIIGWGSKKANKGKMAVLHHAQVMLINRGVCNLPRSYDRKVTPRTQCAGYTDGRVDTCDYDGGGSLSCERKNRHYAQGLVSWRPIAAKCGQPHKYGLYTDVPYLSSWIIDTLLSYDDTTNSVFVPIQEMAKKITPGGHPVSQ